MRRRSRTRRVLKWVGTAASLAIASVWLGSAFLFVRLPLGTNEAIVFRGGGCLLLTGRSEVGGPMMFAVSLQPRGGFGLHGPWSGSATWRAGGTTVYRWFPLWPALPVVVIPTALLWFVDRRRRIPPGHCRKCGYDLTGNVSGRCPECGDEVGADRGIRPDTGENAP